MPNTYALVDATGLVVNRIVLASGKWQPPDGLHLVPDDDEVAEIGGVWTGERFDPPPPPVAPVPQSVSAFQARAALLSNGLLDDVEAAVAAADRLTRTAWEYAQAFERSSPTIATLAAALGLSDEQLDELFRAAAKITA